jgi:hypothetical protein
MPLFVVGQRVNRREDRDVTGAVVLEVYPYDDGTFVYVIQYDEEPNNVGWWFEENLEAE